jgi:type IV secretory pathway VirB10-like protein
MSQYSSIVPTITVRQGYKMKIYLSDDVLISPYARIKERSYATQ